MHSSLAEHGDALDTLDSFFCTTATAPSCSIVRIDMLTSMWNTGAVVLMVLGRDEHEFASSHLFLSTGSSSLQCFVVCPPDHVTATHKCRSGQIQTNIGVQDFTHFRFMSLNTRQPCGLSLQSHRSKSTDAPVSSSSPRRM